MRHGRAEERAPEGGNDPGTCPPALSGQSPAILSCSRAVPDRTDPDGKSLGEKRRHGEQFKGAVLPKITILLLGLPPSQIRSSYQQKLLRRMI